MSSVVSNLKKVGVNKGDKIIVAMDCKNNWRKEIIKDYKAGRRKLLPELYSEFDWLLGEVRKAQVFYFLRLPPLEADDIMAYGSKYYKRKRVIIISPDSDFFQLLVRDNVRLFSPNSKVKIPYKILDLDRKKEKEKAYRSLSAKIDKEKTDNLTKKIETTNEYIDRELLVSLLKLPDFIQARVKKTLDKIDKKVKSCDVDSLPFPAIRERFPQIYSSDYVVSYESCRKKFEKEKLKKKKSNTKKRRKKK